MEELLQVQHWISQKSGYRYDDPWCTFLLSLKKKQSSAKVGAIGSTFGKSEGEDVHDDGKWDDNRRLKEVIQ